MPFASRCASSSLHKDWDLADDAQLVSKVKIALKTKLFELCEVDPRRTYHKKPPKFCTACIAKVLELYPDLTDIQEDKDKTPECSVSSKKKPRYDIDSDDEIGTVLTTETSAVNIKESIDVESLSEEERMHLAYNLGKMERDGCQTYAYSCQDKSLDNMLATSACRESSDTNSVIRSFLHGISGLPLQDSHGLPNYNLEIDKAFESIVSLSAKNTVLPLHFRESILLYALTGSKIALQILGTKGPHASYKVTKEWLTKLGAKSSVIPDGDIIIAFDNNQVLQRRWKVRLRNEVRCNIVTIVACFLIDEMPKLQIQPGLKPNTYSQRLLTQEEVQKVKYLDQDQEVKATHYDHLHAFLKEQISTVVSEQTLAESLTDFIDTEVEKDQRQAAYKICYNCHFEDIPTAKHVCPVCKVSVTKGKMAALGLDQHGNVIEDHQKASSSHKPQEFRISFEKDKHRGTFLLNVEKQNVTPEKCDINLGSSSGPLKPKAILVSEPVYVNPCSYEAVGIVLRNIAVKCGIKRFDGGGRQWVIIVCDGIPYTLCQRLIMSAHVCPKCDATLNGLEECTNHTREEHQNENIDYIKEFDWVILQPGSGHIEMNMVRGIVELGWDVFWKQLAMSMNFRSEIALLYCKKVNDHHKGWTLCRIAREALAKELIVPFVRKEMAKEIPDLSVAAFMKFIMQAADPNYSFIADFTLELLDSIFMYRAGVRRGIHKFCIAGRAKFAKVWSGRVHPIYRELEAADTLAQLRMPEQVLKSASSSLSISMSGDSSKGEGADFRLEEINKQIQHWLPNIPSTEDWKVACCNYDKLCTLRSKMFEQMQVTDPKQRSTSLAQDISEEVTAFRKVLRAQKYLLCPEVSRDHVSLDGHPLDQNLYQFCQTSREKRALFIEEYIKYEKKASLSKPRAPSFKNHPVFIDALEREKYTSIENLTTEEIKKMIQDGIKGIASDILREALEATWQELKRGRKSLLLEFYYELMEYTNDDAADALNVESNNSDDM